MITAAIFPALPSGSFFIPTDAKIIVAICATTPCKKQTTAITAHIPIPITPKIPTKILAASNSPI